MGRDFSAKPAHQGTPYLDGIWAYVLGSAYLSKGNTQEAEKELERLKAIANAPTPMNIE